MNVLMIVSDTVRQDYLGVNGGRVHTPNLDALARESVYFRRAYANSFPTVPTRADYLTGVYAFTDIGWGPLPRAVVPVPQLLAENGVATVGVVDTPFYVGHGYNYDRGFEYFFDLGTQFRMILPLTRKLYPDRVAEFDDPRSPKGTELLEPLEPMTEYDYCAPHTMVTAEKALERLIGKRFFLLVDTWDPHEPWNPPNYYVKKYKPDYDGRIVDPVYRSYADSGLSDEDLETAIACYCGELEMVDRWIGRVLERLHSLGLADDTAVIFVSDHGFYLGEYGQLGKMITRDPKELTAETNGFLRSPLYPELSRVPLMIRVPGVGARNEDRLVSSAINIAPTVLDLFGIDKPEHMLGRSLLPLVRSTKEQGDEFAITAMPLAQPGDETRVVDDFLRNVDEWQPITVTTNEWMMLFARWDEPIELYAIDGTNNANRLGPNVAQGHPEVVKELHAKLISELKRAGADEAAIAARS
jgi:arylsulfatase A-like enzyme